MPTAGFRIKVPVLIVHNQNDGCNVSSFALTDAFRGRLTAAPEVFGGVSRGAPREAMSPHEYLGIEDWVVPQIIGWIGGH
jgi:hypothetical protein